MLMLIDTNEEFVFLFQGYGFKPKYDGEDLAYTVKNLRRSTKYKFKVRFENP